MGMDVGFEEGGLAQRGKKVSGGHFFSPGENPAPLSEAHSSGENHSKRGGAPSLTLLYRIKP